MFWAPQGEADWVSTHASLPIVQCLSNDLWWIYLSIRDRHGKSRIGRIKADASAIAASGLPRVIMFDTTPVLSLGEPGTFDDSGLMPSWLVRYEDSLRLYYIGWNIAGTVPYRVSIGMAISNDDGEDVSTLFPGTLNRSQPARTIFRDRALRSF